MLTIEESEEKIEAEASEYAARSTVPILSADYGKRPRHHGCGILFSFDGRYMLASARHGCIEE